MFSYNSDADNSYLKWTVSWTVIKRKVGNVLSDLRLVSATEGARNWEVAGHLISNNNKSYKEHDSIPASYPDVSLLVKMCAQREREEESSVPFPWSLAVHHQSLVSRSPLPCEKWSAWGGGWLFTPQKK